jgi:hypothetical protein
MSRREERAGKKLNVNVRKKVNVKSESILWIGYIYIFKMTRNTHRICGRKPLGR